MLNNIGISDVVTSSLIINNRVWEDAIAEGVYDLSKTTEVIKNMIYKEGTSHNGLVTHITTKLFKTDIAKRVIDTVDECVYYGEDAEFIYKYIINLILFIPIPIFCGAIFICMLIHFSNCGISISLY